MNIGDLTFGLNAQALAVLALLAERAPDFAPWNEKDRCFEVEIKTYPYYNGRERGIILSCKRGNVGTGDALLITVGQVRSGDQITLQWGISERLPYLVAPTWEFFTETKKCSQLGEKLFPYGACGAVVEKICRLMSEFANYKPAKKTRSKR